MKAIISFILSLFHTTKEEVMTTLSYLLPTPQQFVVFIAAFAGIVLGATELTGFDAIDLSTNLGLRIEWFKGFTAHLDGLSFLKLAAAVVAGTTQIRPMNTSSLAALRNKFFSEELDLAKAEHLSVVDYIYHNQTMLLNGLFKGLAVTVKAEFDVEDRLNADSVMVTVAHKDRVVANTSSESRVPERMQDVALAPAYTFPDGTLKNEGREWAEGLIEKGFSWVTYHVRESEDLVIILDEERHFRPGDKLVAKYVTPYAHSVRNEDGTFSTELAHVNWAVVRRVEAAPYRPLMALFHMGLVRIDPPVMHTHKDARKEIRLQVADLLKDEGRYFMFKVKNTIFTARNKNEARQILKRFGIYQALLHDSHLLTRSGVMMKRPGRVSMKIELKGVPMPEAADGLIATLPDGGIAGQVSVIYKDGELFKFDKGMVRPRLRINGQNEAMVFNANAQLHKTVRAGQEGLAFIINYVKEWTSSMDLQGVLTSLQNPEDYLYRFLNRVKADPDSIVLTPRQKAWVELGMPSGLFANASGFYNFIAKYPMENAYTAQVFGATIDEHGNNLINDVKKIYLPKRIVRRIERQIGRELVVGQDRFRGWRNPKLTDGSSVAEFVFGGTVKWADGTNLRDGIVISCHSTDWKRMGGDFDGDAMTIELSTDELDKLSRVVVPQEEIDALKSNSKPKAVISTNGEIHYQFSQPDNDSQNYVGTLANTTQRLRLAGKLTPELRALSTKGIQGSIFAMKHLVDDYAIKRCLNALYEAMGEIDLKKDLITAIGNIKRADGVNDKLEAFKAATAVATNVVNNEPTPAARALASLILALYELEEKYGKLRADRDTQMPEHLRLQAEAILHERGTRDDERNYALMINIDWKAVVSKYQKAKEADDKEALNALSKEFDAVRAAAKIMMIRGQLSEYGAVAFLSSALVVDIVDPNTLTDLPNPDIYDELDEVEDDIFDEIF